MLQSKYIGWLNEQENMTHIRCLQQTHLRTKDTHRLKVKRWKKIFHANENKTEQSLVQQYLFQTK